MPDTPFPFHDEIDLRTALGAVRGNAALSVGRMALVGFG